MIELVEYYDFRDSSIYKLEEFIIDINYVLHCKRPYVNLLIDSNAIDFIEFDEMIKKDVFISKKSNNMDRLYYGFLFKTNMTKTDYIDRMLCLKMDIKEVSFINYDTEAYHYYSKFPLLIMEKGSEDDRNISRVSP